jgi:uncharacterized iron-regulated membrane protein
MLPAFSEKGVLMAIGRRKLLVAGIITVLVAVGGVVYAVSERDGDEAAPKITRDQAVKAATSAIPGDAVATKREEESERQLYEVTVRTADGTEKEVRVDASTGAVLGVEQGEDADEEEGDSDEGESGDREAGEREAGESGGR